MSEHRIGMARSRGVRRGMIVRLSLMVLVTFGSVALTWLLLHTPQHAQAATPLQVATTKEPEGLVQDGTNVWVAEPGCDLEITSTCSTAFQGIIGRYSLANPNTHTDFTEPANFSSPAFLALDGQGNIWFTEPTTNSIGEYIPGSGTWNQWGTGITAGSAPYNLAFDKNGTIWFSEAKRDAIGFFNTTTHQVVETTLKTGTDPDGMLTDAAGTIWFAEDNAGKLGYFTPTTSGVITVNNVKIGQINPQMLALDAQGNIWYSEGTNVAVGEYNTTTHAHADFSLASALCSTSPCPTGMYVAGIAVDSRGMVWFDESKSGSVGFLNPVSKTVTVSDTLSSPSSGLIVDGNNTLWITEKFSHKLAEIVPGVSPSPTASATTSPTTSVTPSPTPSPQPGGIGPVSKTWYFAEGKVGAGFTEYLTIENPDPAHSCPVTIEYLLSSGSPISSLVTVPPASRWTESVNADLNTQASSQSYVADSAIVTVNSGTACTGVVAERPMYFVNFSGVSSGSDVLGATHTGASFSFADVSTLSNYNTFITILNPPSNTSPAHITATYFLGGAQVGTNTLTVQPGTRGTIVPQRLDKRVVALVTSDQPVVVERPTYFSSFSTGNALNVAGAASVVGASAASSDWRFAEGFVGNGFQEDLALANFGSTAASATVLLEYDNGSTLSVPVTVNAQSQSIVDVNALTANKQGTCLPQPCALSTSVSAEITTSTNTPIVAEREMFFHYSHNANGRTLSAMGGTDITGQSGAATVTAYNFAEGYTNVGYDEWLTLQNPTGSAETINVTLDNEMGNSYTFAVALAAHSRGTIDITGAVIQHLYQPNDGFKGYEVSLSVQSSNGSFVAERPMYWNASGTQGGSDVLGYTGG
ncbi:MAG: hypothetical protein NVSMB27_07080 [Ktedonobacteraceae bacterium]